MALRCRMPQVSDNVGMFHIIDAGLKVGQVDHIVQERGFHFLAQRNFDDDAAVFLGQVHNQERFAEPAPTEFLRSP